MANATEGLFPPPFNMVSAGAAGARQWVLDWDHSIWFLSVDGTPVNGVVGTGTGAGYAAPGSLCVNRAGKALYINTGTKASPAWTVFSAAETVTVQTLTAHSGGGQGSATAITAELAYITVCAADADSVKLPASAAGEIVTVVNDTAHSAQVFGAGTDTINNVTTTVGVPLAATHTATYYSPIAGKWFYLGGSVFTGTFDGVLGGTTPAAATVTSLLINNSLKAAGQTVAAAGATQGNAGAIASQAGAVVFVTSTTSTRGVRLPAAVTNRVVILLSTVTHDAHVYPGTNATIGGSATNLSVTLTKRKAAIFIASSATAWNELTGA